LFRGADAWHGECGRLNQGGRARHCIGFLAASCSKLKFDSGCVCSLACIGHCDAISLSLRYALLDIPCFLFVIAEVSGKGARSGHRRDRCLSESRGTLTDSKTPSLRGFKSKINCNRDTIMPLSGGSAN
jgi:hypothetical protein